VTNKIELAQWSSSRVTGAPLGIKTALNKSCYIFVMISLTYVNCSSHNDAWFSCYVFSTTTKKKGFVTSGPIVLCKFNKFEEIYMEAIYMEAKA